jgi:protein-L-isoaspartate(D-aspartate) O-methyltransferase
MGPYDRIVITAAAPRVPAFLADQLVPGGVAVVPVGTIASQSLVKVTRTGDGLSERILCDCAFVPLIGKDGWANREPH